MVFIGLMNDEFSSVEKDRSAETDDACLSMSSQKLGRP